MLRISLVQLGQYINCARITFPLSCHKLCWLFTFCSWLLYELLEPCHLHVSRVSSPVKWENLCSSVSLQRLYWDAVISLKCWERLMCPVSVKWQVTLSLLQWGTYNSLLVPQSPRESQNSWCSHTDFSNWPLLFSMVSFWLHPLKQHLDFYNRTAKPPGVSYASPCGQNALCSVHPCLTTSCSARSGSALTSPPGILIWFDCVPT